MDTTLASKRVFLALYSSRLAGCNNTAWCDYWATGVARFYSERQSSAVAVKTAQSHNHAWLYSSRFSLFALGVAAILLIGLFWWGGWSRLGQNLAIIEGQKAFLSNKPAEIRAATIKLQKEALKPDSYLSSATLDLVARLAAAQNDFPSSATYLLAEISQDSHNTTAKYIPADWLLWKQLRPVASEPLLRLYSQWKARYSTDPISYSRLALAYAVNCQSKQAQTTLLPGQNIATSATGSFVNTTLARGKGTATSNLGQTYGVRYTNFDAQSGHNIAGPFWDFLNSTGLVLENGKIVTGKLFEPTFFATGLPLSEAYWAKVKVGGQVKDVLIQVFERRILTYTPSNDPEWRVEMSNIGQHYDAWRHGV